jgi:ATP/ADP translocase
MFGSLAACTPYLGGFLGLVILAWINAAQSLSVQFKQKNDEMEKKTWPLNEYEKKEQ